MTKYPFVWFAGRQKGGVNVRIPFFWFCFWWKPRPQFEAFFIPKFGKAYCKRFGGK